MPRKNRRKFFKSNNNNKNVPKENASDVQSAIEADVEKENANANENASTSVENESSMMSHVAIKVPVHNDETVLASNSFIDSSTIHDGTKKRNEQKTVILKVIQFIGQLPPSVSSDVVEHCTVSTVENSSSIEKDDNDFNAYKVDNIEEKTVQSDVDDGDGVGVGVEPKIDRNVKDEEVSDENKKEHNKKVKGRLYDKNYRVESPPQVIATVKQTKHHTMLIQEVAVAVAAAGDNNKIQEVKSYRVESPDTCSVDTNNNIVINQNEVLVQEICESSSSESIKNEPQPTPTIEAVPLVVKVINIQELPSEKVISSSSTPSSSSASTEESITSKIECKTGKKLNKAEEAIIEALYNPELLQRNNNRLLDVITEESCDGSDVDRQSNDNKLNDAGGSDDDNDNGDVFFDISMESAKKPPLFRKRSNIHRKQIPAEQPVLINTKIIETNTVQESCNKWETSQGDSELQAELVYLNSTSSSCTDLDERSDITDTEGEDENETSEDTEINSMLDNLTLPPLDDFVLDPPIEFKFQQPTSVHQSLSYQQESTTEQKLPNILEEDEEQTQQCTLEISESQQRIEDVNKELHHMCTEHNEQQQHNYQKHIKSTEIVLSAPLSPLKSMLDNNKFVDKTEISVDKHKTFEGRTLIYDSGLTLSSFNRTNSSDSSSDSTKSGSTTNSQCTIIRQSSIIDIVLPLSELCMTAMGKHNFRRETEETTPKYTIYKTKNSQSLNAPTIPVITEIELMYEHDDEQNQDKLPDKSITLLQVAPDISFTLPNHHDNKRWYGLQSSVIPNLLVALSPMQKQYMIKTEQYNNTSSPIADLLLDMHNKFVERRAYHETIKSTNTNGNSFTEPSHLLNIVKVPESRQLEFANKPDNFVNETQRKSKSKSVESDTVQVLTSNNSANRVHSVGNNKTDDQNKSDITSLYQNKDILASGSSSSGGSGTSVGANDHNHNIKMNSIRNCILRDEFFKNPSVPIQLADDYVDTKQCELQNELKTLEAERQKIEEELKNIQSLKHFKNEEHLFNQRKLPLNISSNISFNKDNTTNSTDNHFYSEQMSSDNRLSKTSSSDFNEFINSNEQLQREMHDEWQHKVLERNERKLHRILKITTVSSEYISNVDCHNGERRASELGKYFPIENEFLSKVKERRKRLSLQSDSDLNSSTESLHHQNEELNKEQILKKSQKLTQNKENIPVHLKEFLNYYDEEIQLNEESNENSDDGVTRRADGKMDSWNCANSDNYGKLLPHKFFQRDSRSLKVQNKHAKQSPTTAIKSKLPKKIKKSNVVTNNNLQQNDEPSLNSFHALQNEKVNCYKNGKTGNEIPKNDLLHEIDKSLVLAKGFLFEKETTSLPFRIAPKFKATIPPTGVWGSQDSLNGESERRPPQPPAPPIWTPIASPTPERKSFRPVPFESPTLQRKPQTKEVLPPPWSQPNYSQTPIESSFVFKSNSCNNITTPRTKNPIIYRKARVDQFNEKFDQHFQKSSSSTALQKEKSISNKIKPMSPIKPNELVYSIKRDFTCEPKDEIDQSKKMTTQVTPKQPIDGIGPITCEGMPLTLRSEINETNRDKWYRKMYNTIHKTKEEDDGYVTVKYKTRRGNYPYKSNGYASEPDANYDSDYVLKYHGADRKRTTSIGNQYEEKHGSMEQPIKPNLVQYRNQPGRIENYTPGKSSVSDKESKQWLDEHSSVPMCGIKLAREVNKFHLEQQKLSSNYTQGNMSRALKDQGYQSDSTLVFKKRNDINGSQLSPVEIKQVYKHVQSGGEVPLHGFRKQAPEKPRDDTDNKKEDVPYAKKYSHDDRAIINSEIICYPITNITRPLDMFGAFPKTLKSFVPVVPPTPPNRKSSRTNSTLNMVKHLNYGSRTKQNTMNVKFSSTANERTDIIRSRSAGPSFLNSYLTSMSQKETFDNRARLAKKICHRASSSSPVNRKFIQERKSSPSPVAFGRGISKERAFAEEKKLIEEKLSKIHKDLHVSTRILRNPELKSPNEVKKALQKTFKPIAYAKDSKGSSLVMKRSTESQGYKATTSRNTTNSSEQKTTKVTVALSSRGRDSARMHTESPRITRQSTTLSSYSSKSMAFSKTMPDSKSKSKLRSKSSLVSNSNTSLTHSNSTYSIDSVNISKKKVNDSKLKTNPVPVTISNQKLKSSAAKDKLKTKKRCSPELGKKQPLSFQDSSMEDNRKVVESINEAIVLQNEAIKSDTFFQKLFLGDKFRKFNAGLLPNTTVQEKTKMWNNMTAYKSEPSLREPSYYWSHSRPVSSSKFRQMESQNDYESYASYNRKMNDSMRGFVTQQIYKYNSLNELSDEDGNRGRSLDFSYNYHERSKSEPPCKTILTELVRPYSPVVIYGRNKALKSERQRNSRSPSCRRIQSLKSNKFMELSSYQKEIARAQSLGRTDRAKNKLHRSRSLNILNYEKHIPTCNHKKNDRFMDLSEFYSCLERIGQLECATSHSDLRPRRRNEEIIDYDLWQRVREYERNERELNTLVRKLRHEQKEKDLLFHPHFVDEVRWNLDSELGLLTKEKSVENLKDIFHRKTQECDMKRKKRIVLEASKDNYKPLWRANSVLDLASNMTEKYNPKFPATNNFNSLPKPEPKKLGLSKKLLSTLSKDQLNKIKNQLSEIYTGNPSDNALNNEQFVVTVPVKSPAVPERPFLTVRCNSELTKQQIQEPTIDISNLKNVFESKDNNTAPASEISEVEKRSISQSLCAEIKNKFKRKNPVIERVKKTLHEVNCKTLPLPKKNKKDISFSFNEAAPSASKYLKNCIPMRKSLSTSINESESISSETSNHTVIFREFGEIEDVQSKIKYFEEVERGKVEIPTTIYHAREDSSPDEEEQHGKAAVEDLIELEIPQPIAQKLPEDCGGNTLMKRSSTKSPKLSSSQSFTDLKDYFGERSSMKSNSCRGSVDNFSFSNSNLSSKKTSFRSRSSTPDSERYSKSMSEFRDVGRLKMKFEQPYCSGGEEQFDDQDSFYNILSDSELNKSYGSNKNNRKNNKVHILGHEFGNVSHITHKYESQSARARSRTRRSDHSRSPILKQPIKKEDRFMPHINVISKTAKLKEQCTRDKMYKVDPYQGSAGEVAKIAHKFENFDNDLSLIGKMYTSVPDIRELKDVSCHLSGNWVAHKFPKPQDNNRSISSPDKNPTLGTCGRKKVKRPSSTSPIRSNGSSAVDLTKNHQDIFKDQNYNPELHRPRYRYLPDKQLAAEYLSSKKKSSATSTSKNNSVSFKVPPPPPIKNSQIRDEYYLNNHLGGYHSDSQKKYVESDVNIHYKTPVRHEYKQAIPDDELAYQQAEHMKKVYQEERRRKYLQELQDMNNRRHTDNFTPSQKSPISLNRYDDFGFDLPSSKSPVNLPNTVARALFSFQGQSARELSFKKGDIIYIRRQIDKNWYEGEHNAMVGLLPVQYVDIVTNDDVRPPIRKPSEGQARAKFNFLAQTALELSLNKGELVSLTRRVDPNWFEGRVGNKKGIFPVTYVDVLTDIGSSDDFENNITTTTTFTTKQMQPVLSALPLTPPADIIRETKTVRKTEILHVDTATEPISYCAMYNYRPVNNDELELNEGDLIYVLEVCDDGWFVGTSQRTGFFGTFPGNYVKRVY